MERQPENQNGSFRARRFSVILPAYIPSQIDEHTETRARDPEVHYTKYRLTEDEARFVRERVSPSKLNLVETRVQEQDTATNSVKSTTYYEIGFTNGKSLPTESLQALLDRLLAEYDSQNII